MDFNAFLQIFFISNLKRHLLEQAKGFCKLTDTIKFISKPCINSLNCIPTNNL